MNFLAFLRNESPDSWKLIVIMATLGGLANGALLAIINAGAEVSGMESFWRSATPNLLVMFALGMAIFILGKRTSFVLSTEIVEAMVMKMRVRVCDKIRKSELVTVEHLDRNEIYTRISQDTNLVSQSSLIVVGACQEILMLICSLAYLAWLSQAAFLLMVLSTGFAIYVYLYYSSLVQEDLRSSAILEAELFGSLSNILFGFKELRFNTRKSDRLFEALSTIAEGTRVTKTRIGLMFVFQLMFNQVFFYLLLATVVFVLPQYVPAYSSVIMKTTSTILFIIGPINFVVASAPNLARIDVALDNLYRLERALDKPVSRGIEGPREEVSFADFRQIAMDRAMFSYVDDDGEPLFSVGPISLTVNRGEIIFFVGGNGSGKSTITKLLTGLYPPSSGRIAVDGRKLDLKNVQEYRELFAAIFTDFHLFDRLYGLEAVPDATVTSLIQRMELGEKVKFANGKFSTLNLSTGQRKRLALIVALLEDKEIYVLDEWAADQDQHFRKEFYEVILRDLKARGKTVLAVTHDEQYWDVADRLVKLELGQIVSDESLH